MVNTPLRSYIYLLVALSIAALAALAVWLSSGRPHYPIVRATTPDGITLTFIGLPWNDERRCEETRENITTLLHAQCQSCRLTLSECRQQLETSWEKVLRNEPGNMFVVHTDSQYIGIEADPKTAKEICTDMAKQIEKQGRQHAQCVSPPVLNGLVAVPNKSPQGVPAGNLSERSD